MTTADCAFKVGDTFEARLHFTADSVRRFAAMTGDTNPLHHDEAYARASRFGGLIACAGDYTAQMMGALAKALTARGGALGLEFQFKFLRAVHAGETLDLRWVVAAVTPKPGLGGHIVQVEGTLARPDGTVSVAATSKAVVTPGRP